MEFVSDTGTVLRRRNTKLALDLMPAPRCTVRTIGVKSIGMGASDKLLSSLQSVKKFVDVTRLGGLSA